MGCYCLLQGNVLTQGSSLHLSRLLHCVLICSVMSDPLPPGFSVPGRVAISYSHLLHWSPALVGGFFTTAPFMNSNLTGAGKAVEVLWTWLPFHEGACSRVSLSGSCGLAAMGLIVSRLLCLSQRPLLRDTEASRLMQLAVSCMTKPNVEL